jgi:hypothetical protein
MQNAKKKKLCTDKVSNGVITLKHCNDDKLILGDGVYVLENYMMTSNRSKV